MLSQKGVTKEKNRDRGQAFQGLPSRHDRYRKEMAVKVE